MLNDTLTERLATIFGRRHLLTSSRATMRYREGYHCGSEAVCAVVRPGMLVEFGRVTNICVDADVSLIVQASKTALQCTVANEQL